MKALVSWISNLRWSLRMFRLDAGGIRRRRQVGGHEPWMRENRYALNWSQASCLDVDHHACMGGRLRLVAVERG